MAHNVFKSKSFSQMKPNNESNGFRNKQSIIKKNVVLHKAISYIKLRYGCKLCGYKECDRALHFHHINPNEKRFNISTPPKHLAHWAVVEKEIQKCVILCGNCHSEIHSGIKKLPEGLTNAYK